MTLKEAHTKCKPGDRLKNTEYQLTIPRQADLMATMHQMNQAQFRATNNDKWVVLPGKEVRQ